MGIALIASAKCALGQSGGDITLKADNRVRLLSGQDESAQSGSDSSGSAAIGLSVGLGAKSAGLSLTASASRALGRRNGSATTQQDSTVAAGKKLTIDSGGDTDILGATASGETVKAAVGGNLNMASLQDTATFKEDSKNIGFNASVPITGSGGSASLTAGKTHIRSDYASTQTTSGIKAGDGGFDVQVKGKTTLDGAVIASSDKAVLEGKNRFSSEGGLELKDIANSAKYSADSVSAGVGISGASKSKDGPALNSAGIGSDSGHASSITQAGISGIAGDTAVRSGDVGSGIKPIFDADRARADVNAQVVITKDFSPSASNYIGKVGDGHLDEAAALEVQATRARDAGNTELADRLALQAQELKDNWGPDGKLRVLAHMAVGALAGGVDGAVGAGAGTVTAPAVMAQLEKSGLPEDLAKGIVGAVSTTVGAIAGGTAGGAAAMNEVANNYLSHMERQRLNDAKRACISAGQQCETATALQRKDELSDKLLANAAAVCKGADCREVVLFVTKEMERLGCASGPYAVCNDLWGYQYAAQLKAQGLESVYPESWLLDAKAAVDLGKLGINLLARSGKDSLTSLRQLELMKSNDIVSAKIGLNFYRDNGSINPFADRISELASQATKNEFSDTVVLGKYIENSSQSYEKIANARGATYFELPGRSWGDAVAQLGGDKVWEINKKFLDNQISQDKSFIFTGNPAAANAGNFTKMEYQHLLDNGYFIVSEPGGMYRAIKTGR